MAYYNSWPSFLAFQSVDTAEEGGYTTLGNLADISHDLADILPKFAELGVMCRRTYHEGKDISWKTAFRTESKDEVAKIAKKMAWIILGRLKIHCKLSIKPRVA